MHLYVLPITCSSDNRGMEGQLGGKQRYDRTIEGYHQRLRLSVEITVNATQRFRCIAVETPGKWQVGVRDAANFFRKLVSQYVREIAWRLYQGGWPRCRALPRRTSAAIAEDLN
jgi:hypothetical protein